MRSLLLPALLVSVSFLLSGCTGNWLVGKWEFDKERTLAVLEQTAEAPPGETPGGGLLKDIVGGLQKGLSRVMFTQFEGTQFEFTATEIRRTRNGVGEAQEYEIIEKPSASSYLVKTDDGVIVTWAKVEGGLRLKLSGEGENWVYFKPAK